ncbi:MAG: iduronate-2-sulfatase, partial [Acidobacteriota bacterium]|nr:iduronate-2-sulfatase [Acidobacteriota bacterium]
AGEELYDYQADPREIRNMAQDESMSGLKKQLRSQLLSITRQRGMTAQQTGSADGRFLPSAGRPGVWVDDLRT